MKPFAGGKLLRSGRKVRIARYQLGGAKGIDIQKTMPITPVQCLSYTLSQAGVATAVPGCASVAQLEAALEYIDAPVEERDYASALNNVQQHVSGECVYCNHCLPCPAGIDIGATIRLLETAQQRRTAAQRVAYRKLPARASACTECGACAERCPFGVSVVEKISQAAKLFES